MTTPSIITIIVAAVIVLWLVSCYNSLVRLRNDRENAFANIDVQLKQRHDLIPQLVSTVKGYATHERELLEGVTQARAAAMGASSIDDKIKAEGELSKALAGLRVSLEAYPDLKANQNFLQLQDELAGTENRINTERTRYNEAVEKYNVKILRFPGSLFAWGYEEKEMFKADATASKAPTVDFGTGAASPSVDF